MIEGRPLSEICRRLAEAAALGRHKVLAQILRMAALEAAENGARYIGPATDIRDQMVGTWDWDVVNDRVYADGPSARLFGVADQDAARGSPLKEWLSAIHPNDLAATVAGIERAMASGDVFAMEYRIVTADEVRWVFVRGRCTRDRSGRPVRFPGAIVDITHERSDDNQFSIAPQ